MMMPENVCENPTNWPPLVEVVMASANPHKVTEIENLLRRAIPDLVVLPRPTDVGEVVEDADTLLGNARLKAHALAQATQKPAVADDTGLFVDALGGDPGVYTARYAGEKATYADNCEKLLRELNRVGATQPSKRTASFVTVAMVAWPDGSEVWAEGRVQGIITTKIFGSGGFGYDPVFAPIEPRATVAPTLPWTVQEAPAETAAVFELEADLPTFAQLGNEIKNTISHRSRAFESLALLLRK
jgi:XTP/dITP diphosphohydrolase